MRRGFQHGLWNPFQQLRNEMDRLLTDFFGATTEEFLPSMFRAQPAVNVWEKDDALIVESEIPGVKSEELEISVTGNQLSIRINRAETSEEGVTYHRRERPVGAVCRVLQLPVEVDAEKVEAVLRDGVLTITLPKAESAKPRKIQVAGN